MYQWHYYARKVHLFHEELKKKVIGHTIDQLDNSILIMNCENSNNEIEAAKFQSPI